MGISDGKYCENCLAGYVARHDGACAPEACMKNGDECSNHGMCVAMNDNVSCMCFPGYTGTQCTECDESHTLVGGSCISNNCTNELDGAWHICSEGGRCVIDTVGTTHKCHCNYGNEGEKCVDCSVGFSRVAHKCISDVCLTGSGALHGICNFNGQCTSNEAHEYWCECFDGVTGEVCDTCAEGQTKMKNGRCVDDSCVFDDQECAGHGICMTDLGDYMCHCLPHFDAITGCTHCE